MIGIYKITNKLNGKSYIGQSNDINRRFSEHKNKTDLAIDKAIHKYGSDNFSFEVIEECNLSDLDEREQYWIAYYNTYQGFGYNCSIGGSDSRCEANGRTKLTNEDVYNIRECYNNHCRRKDVYELYKDKISFSAFASIWDGTTWKGIHADVYTQENLLYYMRHASDGDAGLNSSLTNEEVLAIRTRYIHENAKSIYSDYNNRCSYQTFQQILWGRTYKNVPIYKKKEKRWIYPEACNDYLL